MARRIAIKDIREIRPTIIGAGITEQWYFTHLQSLFRLKIKIRPRFFGQEDIHSLEKRIQQVLDDNGKAVVVFDADVSTWDDKEKQRLTTLKEVCQQPRCGAVRQPAFHRVLVSAPLYQYHKAVRHIQSSDQPACEVFARVQQERGLLEEYEMD